MSTGTTSRRPSCPTRASRSPIRAAPIRSCTMMEGVIQRGTGRSDRLARPAARRQDRHDQRFRTTPGSSASRPISSCGVYRRLRPAARRLGKRETGARPSRRPPSAISWRRRSRTSRRSRSASRRAPTGARQRRHRAARRSPATSSVDLRGRSSPAPSRRATSAGVVVDDAPAAAACRWPDRRRCHDGDLPRATPGARRRSAATAAGHSADALPPRHRRSILSAEIAVVRE